jgi:hypothetical protein
LSAIEPANSGSSCITVPTIARQGAAPIASSARPPTSTSPCTGFRIPSISLISVVLPHPDGPTMATDSPGSMLRLI